MSGLYEMFNSYQATSSPTLKMVEAEKTLKNSPLKIAEGQRYAESQKKWSKEKDLRVSSSAKNMKYYF